MKKKNIKDQQTAYSLFSIVSEKEFKQIPKRSCQEQIDMVKQANKIEKEEKKQQKADLKKP